MLFLPNDTRFILFERSDGRTRQGKNVYDTLLVTRASFNCCPEDKNWSEKVVHQKKLKKKIYNLQNFWKFFVVGYSFWKIRVQKDNLNVLRKNIFSRPSEYTILEEMATGSLIDAQIFEGSELHAWIIFYFSCVTLLTLVPLCFDS